MFRLILSALMLAAILGSLHPPAASADVLRTEIAFEGINVLTVHDAGNIRLLCGFIAPPGG